MATVAEQTTNYDFDIVGRRCLRYTPFKTLFPYIANDDI
jgi:hypothetical protein